MNKNLEETSQLNRRSFFAAILFLFLPATYRSNKSILDTTKGVECKLIGNRYTYTIYSHTHGKWLREYQCWSKDKYK